MSLHVLVTHVGSSCAKHSESDICCLTREHRQNTFVFIETQKIIINAKYTFMADKLSGDRK